MDRSWLYLQPDLFPLQSNRIHCTHVPSSFKRQSLEDSSEASYPVSQNHFSQKESRFSRFLEKGTSLEHISTSRAPDPQYGLAIFLSLDVRLGTPTEWLWRTAATVRFSRRLSPKPLYFPSPSGSPLSPSDIRESLAALFSARSLAAPPGF